MIVGLGQEESYPRFLWITLRRRFQNRQISLVFGPIRRIAYFLGEIISY